MRTLLLMFLCAMCGCSAPSRPKEPSDIAQLRAIAKSRHLQWQVFSLGGWRAYATPGNMALDDCRAYWSVHGSSQKDVTEKLLDAIKKPENEQPNCENGMAGFSSEEAK